MYGDVLSVARKLSLKMSKKFILKFELETPDVLEHGEVKKITSRILDLCEQSSKYKMTLASAEQELELKK